MNCTTEERFLRHVMPDPNSGCWLWTASLGSTGYGQFYFQGPGRKAHRVSHILFVGPIPADRIVCHKCDVRSCVNPHHLYLGTFSTNIQDAYDREKRSAKGENSPRAKLRETDVLEIRTDGRSQRTIAADYGVSREAIAAIRNRRSWAHI